MAAAGPSTPAHAGIGHAGAVAVMVGVTLMWSTAGMVTRHLQEARGFETTFWRSLFAGLAIALWMLWRQGPGGVAAQLASGGRALWVSGLCWAAMFTCFMLALTMTTVANVLVTMSLGPLFTALLARLALGQPMAGRTWWAVIGAGAGIAWMYSHGIGTDAQQLLGTAVALGVPVAAAINWTLLQRQGASVDLVPALLIGAAVSCLITGPLAWPLGPTPHDLGLLALLGVFQLAVPCAIAVVLARRVPAAEMSLLALLEVVFGIALTWIWGGEHLSGPVLSGGGVVLLVLALHQGLALREARALRA